MKSQNGFTLIEVMIALLIAAVALSGLIYMISSTAILASQSKANKEAAQIAASEMEKLRNMDFDAIGFPDATGDEPLGVLSRITTTRTAITTYDIKYDIRWVDDPNTARETKDYKMVKITVSWKQPRSGSYSLISYISQASRRAPGRITVPPPPDLLVPPSPAPESIVRGSNVPICVRVNEPSMLFSAIEVRIGNNLAGERLLIQPPSSYKEFTYYWDTTQFLDGKYEISAYAYEARGGTSFRTWYYIVDNSEPTQAPYLTLNSANTDTADLTWTTIYDGYEKVPTYEFSYFDFYNATGNQTTVTLTGSELNQSSVSRTLPLYPWGYFRIKVRGFSYGRYSPYSNEVRAKTKISLTITKTIQGNTAKLTLNWTKKPPYAIVSKFEILMQEGTTNPQIVATINDPSAYSYSISINKHLLGNVKFKVKATFEFLTEITVNESDWVVAE